MVTPYSDVLLAKVPIVGLGFVGKVGFEYSVTELFEYSNNIRVLRILNVSFTVTASRFFEVERHTKQRDRLFNDERYNNQFHYLMSSMNTQSQESCAIAKMTAQCAIYMGVLKIFGTP